MSAAVIDGPRNEQAQEWWFLDLLVVEDFSVKSPAVIRRRG
jgi:hypothetical protein